MTPERFHRVCCLICAAACVGSFATTAFFGGLHLCGLPLALVWVASQKEASAHNLRSHPDAAVVPVVTVVAVWVVVFSTYGGLRHPNDGDRIAWGYLLDATVTAVCAGSLVALYLRLRANQRSHG